MPKIYELQNDTYNVGEALKDVNEKLAKTAASPSENAIEDIKALTKQKENLELRYNTLKEQLDSAKKAQNSSLIKEKKAKEMPSDPKERMIKMQAAWIRKTVAPENAEFQQKWNALRQELTGNETLDTNGVVDDGKDLLPVNVSNQLIHEPLATNPLRKMESVSTVTNLIMPRIAFDLSDDSFVGDGEVAKEIKLKTDTIEFGRHKMMVRAGISDTILHGTDTGLVEYVNNALASAIQLKERSVQLATDQTPGIEHMSFYSSHSNIKTVKGATLYKAIRAAIADLDDMFQDNVKILMRRQDYYDMIDELANGSATLYQAQPETVLGAPVEFTSAAVTPIVGDFSYAQLNYEINASQYEQYKDYERGINYFQFTTWFDHQIKLASAFRLASTTADTKPAGK